MVTIHVKLFTTCTSTCTYSKDMQCGSKNKRLSWKQQLLVTRTRLQRLCRHISMWYGLLSLILHSFEYWGSSFKSRLSRLSFEQHCSNRKERLMKMPNIQYVCLSGSEVTYPSLQWVGVLGWFAFLEIHYPLMYIIYISISFISIIILKQLVVLKAPSDWLLKLQVSFVIHLQATTTLL